MGFLLMKYSKLSACLGFMAGVLFFLPAFSEEADKSEKVDCSHLTAEQMGDKDACWNVKKTELRHTQRDTQAYVEIVSDAGAGGSIVNVTQVPLSSDTNNNVDEVPWFKSAVPNALSPSKSGTSENGNQ